MLIRRRSNLALAAILVVALGLPALAQDRPAEEKPEPPLSLLLDQSRATRVGRLMPGLEHKLVAVPDGVSTRAAAAAMLQGMTAHYLTQSTYELRAGDTCLVHAAAGARLRAALNGAIAGAPHAP